MTHRVVDRDALVGVVIAGGFGIGWAFWAASGLPDGTATAVRIAGVVAGVVIVVGALLQRSADPRASASITGSASMFTSRGYLVWVAVELVALFGGNAALGAAGHTEYVAAWTALVVGVHFLGFGRLFATVFYWLGAAFIAGAVVGVAAGASTGTSNPVEASTGLIAATSLFTAGGWRLLASPPSEAPHADR